MRYTANQKKIVAQFEIGAAPEKVLVFRDGQTTFQWDDGTMVVAVMDQESADSIIAEFESRGNNLVFDYEHQSEGGQYSSPSGKAPAAGWVTAFEYRPGVGLMAAVNWTDDAKKELTSRQYRYFSPVFYLDDESGRVTEIKSIALTNTPATNHQKPLVAKKFGQAPASKLRADAGDTSAGASPIGASLMDPLIVFLKKLGINPDEFDSPEDMFLAAMEKMAGGSDTEPEDEPTDEEKKMAAKAIAASARDANTVKAVATSLGCDADGDKIVAAIASLKDKTVDPTKYVAMSDHKETLERLEKLESKQAADARAKFFADGQAAGKITAGNRPLWEIAYDADAQKAAEQLEKAPALVSTSRVTKPDAPKDDRKTIIAKAARAYEASTDQNKAICSRKAYVNDSLREARLPALTAEELNEIGA